MPRKGENIFKRNDGRWEGRYIRGRDSDGKALYGSVYGKTYTATKEKQLSAKAAVLAGASAKSNEGEFSSISSSWLRAREKGWKESTLRKYEEKLRVHLLPEFGNRCLASISNDEICAFFDRLMSENGKCLSTGAAGTVLTVLRQIRKHAIRSGISVGFDTACISLGKSPNRREITVFTEEEEKQIVGFVLSNMDLYGIGVLIVLFTGIRIGELCALKWEDLDFEKKELHVKRTTQRVRTGAESGKKTILVITAPKSQASHRTIPIIRELEESLKGRTVPGAYVLSGMPDKPVEPEAMRRHFKKLLQDCGVRNANFHTTRHTFATRCIENGMDAKTLSELLGHSDVSITLARYVHTSMEHKADQMRVLSGLFGVRNFGQN